MPFASTAHDHGTIAEALADAFDNAATQAPTKEAAARLIILELAKQNILLVRPEEPRDRRHARPDV